VPIVQDLARMYNDCALGFSSGMGGGVQGTFLHTRGDRTAPQPNDPHIKLAIWAVDIKFTFTETTHSAAEE
jgi:hypothetical protein